MGIYSKYRISKASAEKVPPGEVETRYRQLRSRTFWGATIAYSLYYVCRLAFSIVKQPIIDGGILNATQLGVIGSAFLLVYAAGKFVNSFFADYCNIRRFMALGLLISSGINLILALLGYMDMAFSLPGFVIMIAFSLLWGLNGLGQSMGAAPGVISLSRWFPLRERGTWYSIFSASPYLGEALAFVLLGFVAKHLGWQSCFLMASICGFAGALVALSFISDTPESRGLPPIDRLASEEVQPEDRLPTISLQKRVFRNPGIWIIALSSAFIYVTRYAVSGWGVLFLQKAKGFPLEGATSVTAVYAVSGIAGTVIAGWLSDRVFKGRRIIPVAISGLLSLLSLSAFLLLDGDYFLNMFLIALFSLSAGVLYCIVAGIIALDIVPRKATGAAVGIIGIVCYVAASLQDLLSGYLIDNFIVDGQYDFLPVTIFWILAAVLSLLIPLLGRRWLQARQATV